MKNDINNSEKRTALQIAKVLRINGLDTKVENLGNNRTFAVKNDGLKTRVVIKKAGYILERSNINDTHLIFNCW